MSANQSRLELLIDVLDRGEQRALTLPTLKPRDLVAAVLDEFGEVEFLGANPDDYQLVKADTRVALDDEPLERQLLSGARLAFIEREIALPVGTQRPSDYVYLREQDTGSVYQLHWLPAIIGRPDNAGDNDRLAVNLAVQAGLRVSRRHAQIVERAGEYYVERMADNPLSVRDDRGETTPVTDWHPLRHGDVIVLDRSQIALKFIVRAKQEAACPQT